MRAISQENALDCAVFAYLSENPAGYIRQDPARRAPAAWRCSAAALILAA